VVTQQGTGLLNLTFRSQQLLSKNTEDGARHIDAFIIETVKDQIEKHAGKLTTAEKAVVVTGDQNMRVTARARGVPALSGADFRREMKKNEVPEMPKKKAWS
jgi:rRNA-processing protein FCF1